MISNGTQPAVRVASWVVEEEERLLNFSLVGFLKQGSGGVNVADLWLNRVWGKKPIGTKMMDWDTIIIQLSSAREVEEVLDCANILVHSPFVAIDRWMEVIGSPPSFWWVRLYGVPLQVWREGVFRLLGGCLGQTVEVDDNTMSKEVLSHRRVKIMARKVCKLPKEIHLWVDDLQFSILVAEEVDRIGDFAVPVQKEGVGASILPVCQMLKG
ncbi:hypothetical protein AAC387_Pa01g2666 [Persea americana]